MIKKIFLFLALLLVAGIAVIYFFGSGWLNSAVKRGIEDYGPQMTQTPVTVESVSLSIFSGKGTLKGLHVGNPEGYQTENIFALEQIEIEIDTSTVLEDVIIINKIHILRPAVSYERTLTTSNIRTIRNNIEAFIGPSTPGQDVPEGEGAKKQVIVRQLLIEDGTVFLSALGAELARPRRCLGSN